MRERHLIGRSACLAITGVIMSFLAVPSALAADAAKEIATAAQHAALAAQGGAINVVHSHLHHAVNCLEGPAGTHFASKEFNPCATLGNGAIPDTTDAATGKTLEAAVEKALSGIAETDLSKAQQAASETEAMLKAVK